MRNNHHRGIVLEQVDQSFGSGAGFTAHLTTSLTNGLAFGAEPFGGCHQCLLGSGTQLLDHWVETVFGCVNDLQDTAAKLPVRADK